MNSVGNKQFICLKEAAELLGINVQTMKKIVENAEGLAYTRLGRKILINKDALLKYMNEHTIIRYK